MIKPIALWEKKKSITVKIEIKPNQTKPEKKMKEKQIELWYKFENLYWRFVKVFFFFTFIRQVLSIEIFQTTFLVLILLFVCLVSFFFCGVFFYRLHSSFAVHVICIHTYIFVWLCALCTYL